MLMNFAVAFDWVETAIETLYTDLGGIVTALMILCTIICLAGMLFSKNQKNVEEYKSWFKRIIVCYVIYLCLGSITSGISTILKDQKGLSDGAFGRTK